MGTKLVHPQDSPLIRPALDYLWDRYGIPANDIINLSSTGDAQADKYALITINVTLMVHNGGIVDATRSTEAQVQGAVSVDDTEDPRFGVLPDVRAGQEEAEVGEGEGRSTEADLRDHG